MKQACMYKQASAHTCNVSSKEESEEKKERRPSKRQKVVPNLGGPPPIEPNSASSSDSDDDEIDPLSPYLVEIRHWADKWGIEDASVSLHLSALLKQSNTGQFRKPDVRTKELRHAACIIMQDKFGYEYKQGKRSRDFTIFKPETDQQRVQIGTSSFKKLLLHLSKAENEKIYTQIVSHTQEIFGHLFEEMILWQLSDYRRNREKERVKFIIDLEKAQQSPISQSPIKTENGKRTRTPTDFLINKKCLSKQRSKKRLKTSSSSSSSASSASSASISFSQTRQTFFEDDWIFFKEIWIGDESSESLSEQASMFRRNDGSLRICLFYGDDEYEGVDNDKPCKSLGPLTNLDDVFWWIDSEGKTIEARAVRSGEVINAKSSFGQSYIHLLNQ